MKEPVLKREMNGGTQEIYRFANGFGASVIRGGRFAYGGLEMAVIKFSGENPLEFKLTYDTPITDDVIGDLDDVALQKLLDDVEALPAAEQAA